jgi:competence protein ComEA
LFFVLNQPAGTAVTISVPSPTATLTAGVSATPEAQLVNINMAPAWLLVALPGIGEARARAIVDYREREGPFQRIDQLMQVPDIGPATYRGLRGLVTVGELP